MPRPGQTISKLGLPFIIFWLSPCAKLCRLFLFFSFDLCEMQNPDASKRAIV